MVRYRNDKARGTVSQRLLFVPAYTMEEHVLSAVARTHVGKDEPEPYRTHDACRAYPACKRDKKSSKAKGSSSSISFGSCMATPRLGTMTIRTKRIVAIYDRTTKTPVRKRIDGHAGNGITDSPACNFKRSTKTYQNYLINQLNNRYLRRCRNPTIPYARKGSFAVGRNH